MKEEILLLCNNFKKECKLFLIQVHSLLPLDYLLLMLLYDLTLEKHIEIFLILLIIDISK